jgi:hypothetical protein
MKTSESRIHVLLVFVKLAQTNRTRGTTNMHIKCRDRTSDGRKSLPLIAISGSRL